MSAILLFSVFIDNSNTFCI